MEDLVEDGGGAADEIRVSEGRGAAGGLEAAGGDATGAGRAVEVLDALEVIEDAL